MIASSLFIRINFYLNRQHPNKGGIMSYLGDWWEYSLFGAKRNGKYDGKREIPRKNQPEHPPYEKQLTMRTNNLLQKLAQKWAKEDKKLKDTFIKALREYIDIRKKAPKEIAEAETMLTEHRRTVEKLNHSSENPRLGKFPYWMIIFLIAVGEIPLTAKVFEIFGENVILTYVFALVLCISVPATAHFAGSLLKEKLNWKSCVVLFLDIGILLLTLGTVSWLREKSFEVDAQELLGFTMDPRMITFTFFAIQMLIFATAATASYMAHDAHPDKMTAERLANTAAKNLAKEAGEARRAEQKLNLAAKKLAFAEAIREKVFCDFQAQAEAIMALCHSTMETYRGANIRTRADSEIAAFSSYPKLTMPVTLAELDREYGFAIPEAVPITCPICGTGNPYGNRVQKLWWCHSRIVTIRSLLCL